MPQPVNQYQAKIGEIEQSVRSLINSALFYLNDPSLPDAMGNARRCLETSKYVLEGIYMPSTPEEKSNTRVESWGFSNNVDDHTFDHPHYPM